MRCSNRLLKYWRFPINSPRDPATTSAEATRPRTRWPRPRQSTRSGSTTSEPSKTQRSEQSTYFLPYPGNLKPQGQYCQDARRDNRPLRQGLRHQAKAKPKEAETVRRLKIPNRHKGQDLPHDIQLRLRGEHLLKKIPNARPLLDLQRKRAQVMLILKQAILPQAVHQHQIQRHQLRRHQELVYGL